MSGSNMMNCGNIKLFIGGREAVYQPECVENITWETTRKSAPARLEFAIRTDGAMSIAEGNEVKFICNGITVFYGYIFSFAQKTGGFVTALAYDQLRYFKNKDSYAYRQMTADELLRTIISDYGLIAGDICTTGYKIPSRLECGQTLFDIISNALDITKSNTGRSFVMYDEGGKINLCEPEKLRTDILIDENCAESFEFISSIDSGVYNKIKISRSRENSAVFDMAEDKEKISKWGILQYFRSTDKVADADSLLNLYASPNNSLNIINAVGDVRVRGGSAVAAEIKFGETKIKRYVQVERAKHEFRGGLHLMSLECALNLL